MIKFCAFRSYDASTKKSLLVRTYLLLLFTLVLSTRVPAQTSGDAEVGLSSVITRAAVFREGAQITREGSARLERGRSTLVFDDLTSTLDPASVQVSGEKTGVLILSVSHRLNFYEVPDRTEAEVAIYGSIEALERERRRLQTEVAIAKEEEEVLRANRDLGGTASGLNSQDLERGVTFQRERIRAIKLSYLALDDSLRAVQERRDVLQQQLADLGEQRQRPTTSEVVVVVESTVATSADFTLTYLIAEAGWTPEYDVRVANTGRPIDLRYRANVQQKSGEDWTDVRLTLSTGDPSVSAIAPELRSWRVRPGLTPPVYGPVVKRKGAVDIPVVSGTITDEQGLWLVGASVMVAGTNIGTVTDLAGMYELALPTDAQSLTVSYTGFDTKTVAIDGPRLDVQLEEGTVLLEEVVVVGYGGSDGTNGGDDYDGTGNRNARMKQQQEAGPPPVPTQTQRRATTVAFAIEVPYTIASDGQARSVEIKRYDVPATYRHLAVPKISNDVFLSAIVRDWEQYDLISGNLQLFFEGTYLGTSYLDVDNTADSLQLSLGRDAGVVVSRELDADFRKGSGFFSGRRTESRGWVLSVRNTKRQPIDLTLVDQVPVSAQGNIDVDVELPDDTVVDNVSGEVRWQLTLPPAAERKWRFGYRVRYPAGERVYVE